MNKKKLITERRGVVESAIPYTHAVLNELYKHIKNFSTNLTPEYLESVADLRKNGYLPSPDYSKRFVIPYRNLARYIDDDIFEDFPIAEIRCIVNLIYVDTQSPMHDNFSVGGGAWPIYRGDIGTSPLSQRVKPENFPISKKRRESVDRSIIAELDFDLTTYKGFKFSNKKDRENFDRELRAVVFHEMMHIYEMYKNKNLDIRVVHKTSKETKRPKSRQETSKAHLSDTKFIGIPKELNDEMFIILNHYYNALPTEVKAITHEMYPFVMDFSIDEFFNTYQGRRVKGLMSFDSEEFYDNLISLTDSYFERLGVPFNQETMEGFFNQIRMRILKKYERTTISNHEEVDENLLKQKTLKSLIDYMSKAINKAGEKLFKNVGRLYSLKSELKNG